MRGANNITENEWVHLGHACKSIRDRIMDYCVISCNRFGKSSDMYKNFRVLDSRFLSVRSKLDDFVSGAYSMNQHVIGDEHCSITSVFFGERESPLLVQPEPFKRGQLPHSFEQAQEQDLNALIRDIKLFMASLEQHAYIVSRFKEKEAKAKLVRFHKSVEKIKMLVVVN